jgi:hypothetical protein
MLPEKDSDTISITSSGSAISSVKLQDAIELYVHGIEPVGRCIAEWGCYDDHILSRFFVFDHLYLEGAFSP